MFNIRCLWIFSVMQVMVNKGNVFTYLHPRTVAFHSTFLGWYLIRIYIPSGGHGHYNGTTPSLRPSSENIIIYAGAATSVWRYDVKAPLIISHTEILLWYLQNKRIKKPVKEDRCLYNPVIGWIGLLFLLKAHNTI